MDERRRLRLWLEDIDDERTPQRVAWLCHAHASIFP